MEILEIKIKQNKTVIKMKKGFNRLIRTFDAAKERIINLNRSVEITLTETQREKMEKKK